MNKTLFSLLLVAIILLGSSGYHFIDAFYMAVITITTVGFEVDQTMTPS